MDGLTEDEKGAEAALERARDAAHSAGGSGGGDAALMLKEAEKAGKELTAPDAKGNEPPPAAEETPSKLTGDEAPRAGEKVMELPEQHISSGGENVLPEMALSEMVTALPEPKAEPPAEPWARMQYDIMENRTKPPPPSPIAEKMAAVGWQPTQQAPAASPASWQDLKAKLDAAPAPAAAPPPTAPAATAAAPGPDWEGLQRQIQAAQRGADTQRTIAAMLHAAAPGFQIPGNIGEGEVAAAKLPLEIEQHRRQYEAAQRAQNEKLLADAKAREYSDPNSEISKRAQERYATAFGSDPRLVPAGLKQMSAAEIEKMTGTATTLTGQKNTADVAAAHMKAAHDEKVAAEAAKQAQKDKDAAKEEEAVKALREATKADPDFHYLGIKPEVVDGMNFKTLEEERKRLDDFRKKGGPTGGGAPAKPVHKLEDISSESDRAKVKAIGEGRADITIAGMKDRGRIAGLVMQVYPDFDQTRFGAYKHVVEHQATDKDIVAAATAQDHIKRARANIPKNYGPQILNRMKQAVLTGEGSPEMTPFEVDVKVAADEYAKALGNNAQSGRQEVEHLLSAAQSPQQLEAALGEVEHLLESKQQQWREQLKKVAPRGSTPLETRPLKSGDGVAYKARSGANRWFTTEKEAEAH